MNSTRPGFLRFAGLTELNAPDLLQRMTNTDLPVDGQRYGIQSRLIARPSAGVCDLALRCLQKLADAEGPPPEQWGAVVLSSRIVEVQAAAETVVARWGLRCEAHGIERACSGFPAATELAVSVCRRLDRPVALVAAEILSRNINWEPASGTLADQKRASGQAAKLFADGAAATLVVPENYGGHEILDAWAGEVPDEDQLLQKIDVPDIVDPWGRRVPGLTACLNMPGRRGFLLLKRAPRIMLDSLRVTLQRAGIAESLDRAPAFQVVPHQANGLITAKLAELLADAAAGQPIKVWDCIADSGNTVSASIPLAMAAVQDELPDGLLVAMPSVGAGGPGYRPDILSTGCVLIRVWKAD
jgi:3-oxoacyl-[acyl-carrier-protein] synthase III